MMVYRLLVLAGCYSISSSIDISSAALIPSDGFSTSTNRKLPRYVKSFFFSLNGAIPGPASFNGVLNFLSKGITMQIITTFSCAIWSVFTRVFLIHDEGGGGNIKKKSRSSCLSHRSSRPLGHRLLVKVGSKGLGMGDREIGQWMRRVLSENSMNTPKRMKMQGITSLFAWLPRIYEPPSSSVHEKR